VSVLDVLPGLLPGRFTASSIASRRFERSRLERQDSRLVLAHVHEPVLQVAREAGLLKKTGEDHILPDIAAATQWALPTESGN